MNTPNNLEWVDEVLIQLPQYNCGLDPITEQPFTAEEHYAVYPELKTAKQTIATKLAEAEQKGYGALYQFLISRLDVKTGRISLSSKQLAKFHAEYIATLTNDKELEQ